MKKIMLISWSIWQFILPYKGDTIYFSRYLNSEISFNESCKAYNQSSSKDSLSSLIFGCPFKIKDIFLASQLAQEEKITPPTGGIDPKEMFITQLADTDVTIKLNQEDIRFRPSLGIVFFDSKKECFFVRIEAGTDLIQRKNSIDINFINGRIQQGALPEGENGLSQFFNSYVSVYDFFLKEIITPKNLIFKEQQKSTGIGDSYICLAVGAFLNKSIIENLSGFLILHIPSPKKQKGEVVWELELTNNGGVGIELGLEIPFKTSIKEINPCISFSSSYYFNFHGARRVPQLKTLTDTTTAPIEQVHIPSSFNGFTVEPFSSFDTNNIREFADEAVVCSIQPGVNLDLKIINLWQEFIIKELSLCTYYELIKKFRTKHCVIHSESKNNRLFNTQLLEEPTRMTRHTIGWELSYNFLHRSLSTIALSLGSCHIIGGKNTLQTNTYFGKVQYSF